MGTAERIPRRRFLALAAAAAVLPATRAALALERDPNGFYMTGSGVRVKKVGPLRVKVYSIAHYMRELPPSRSKQAVIDMITDKAFTWRLLRDLSVKQITGALRDAYAMNGYADRAKIDALLAAFTHEEKEGATVSIAYSPHTDTTTLRVSGDGTASVRGVDFMHATWRIWFGRIDQPELGDALMARIPVGGASG